jgi:hypothetical protein
MFKRSDKSFLGTRLLWQSTPPAGGDGLPPSGAPATPPPAPDPNSDPVRSFKQSELDHLFAERARQAQGKGVTDLLKDLGLEKTDDLKAIIAKAREQENAQKTEAQKLADEIAALKKSVETANSEKQTALATATERLMKAAVLGDAMKQFDDTELNSVWMALKADATLFGKIKPKDDGESFEGIADVLKEIAKAHPRWLKMTSTGAIGTPRPGAKTPAASPNGGDKKPSLGIRL